MDRVTTPSHLAVLCRNSIREIATWGALAIVAGFVMAALGGCQSELYGPCVEVEDCDPFQADGCYTAPTTGEGVCTIVCQVDTDCPAGENGEVAVCAPIGQGQKICKLK